MDNRKEEKNKSKITKTKITKRKEKKPKSGKLGRKKPLKSVGNFMNRIFKTLGTLSHFGDIGIPDAEDDDGGFRDCTPCTLSGNSGTFKEHIEVAAEQAVKNSFTMSSRGSIKERLSWCYGDKTPGVLGLKNHGNTCFMNAVIQCLSNTDLLAEYLGLEQYKLDFSRWRVNGIVKTEDSQHVRGEVTEQLASLVRALWTLEYTPQLSVEFKGIVSKYGSQFRGNSQHDALEFLLWLLDRVHEDVNSCPSGDGSETKTARKVPAGAGETPAAGPVNTMQPTDHHSFVQEHFQAQYKSSLTCPHCLKQSNTFDPFLCISLPIPLRQTRPLFVTLVFSTKGQRYLRIGLPVPLFGSLASLRRMVADEGKLSPDQVILTEVYPTGFHRSFSDDEDLTSIAEGDVIYAFQAPPLYWRGATTRFSGFHHSLPSSPYSTGPEGQRLPASGALSSEFLNHAVPVKLLLLVCNAAGTGQHTVRFGPPFLMREDRAVSWDQLQQSILSKLYYLMINDVQTQNIGVLFKIRVVGGSACYSYLSPQDRRPLFHPAVDRALKLCGPGGPPHVKLIIEWDHKIKECVFGNIQEEVVRDSESVKAQQQHHFQQQSCTLDECFQLYTKEEQLAPDDAWKCPHCKQLQQGVVKMSLWTLPDILILHLKRFRQVGERRNKLSTLVRFPLAGLDMAPHVVKRGRSSRNPADPWPPAWKQPYPPDAGSPSDFLYDLYAVCNHHGGMHGGHYTAYCRNSVDGQWYGYDDSAVDLMPEEEVCTRGAYILFYQRRKAIPPWSASSSVRGSTSSSMSDHWLIRLAGDSKRGSLVSRASTTGPSFTPDSPESPVFREEPPQGARGEQRGGSETKPFVRGIQGRSVSLRTPTKTKDSLSKMLPLRWSLSSKDRHKPSPGELVEYLESGRRPRCTKDPIVTLMASPPEEGTPVPVGSTRTPEGQCREPAEACSGPRHGHDSTLTRKSSRKTRQDQVKSQGAGQSSGSSSAGPQPGSMSATPSIWDFSSLKRVKSPDPTAARTGSQGEQPPLLPEERRVKKVEEWKSHDSLLSFLKPGFLKKDTLRKAREGSARRDGQPLNRTSSRLSLSNGLPNGAGEGKANGFRRCAEQANGGVNRDAIDIQRSHSSCSIQARSDLTLRRTASLYKSGLAGHPPPPLTVDKPSYVTLQRTRYSTTSLGRKRAVPESSF